MKFSNFHKGERNRIQAEINLTSLVDIIFNLLLFFMLMAGGAQTPGIDVNLPEASSGTTSKDQKSLSIMVTSDQSILVNNRAVTYQELEGMIKELKEKQTKARVFLEADRQAIHGNVVQILDLVKKNGIGEIAIATSPKN